MCTRGRARDVFSLASFADGIEPGFFGRLSIAVRIKGEPKSGYPAIRIATELEEGSDSKPNFQSLVSLTVIIFDVFEHDTMTLLSYIRRKKSMFREIDFHASFSEEIGFN